MLMATRFMGWIGLVSKNQIIIIKLVLTLKNGSSFLTYTS